MLNLVELIGLSRQGAPCRHGNIVDDHACYCHSTAAAAPRKCPIWRHFGIDSEHWRRGSAEAGYCPYFSPRLSDAVTTRKPTEH